MIPALSLIVASYVVLRCFEIIGDRIEKKKGYEAFVIILAILVIIITAFSLYDILSAGIELSEIQY